MNSVEPISFLLTLVLGGTLLLGLFIVLLLIRSDLGMARWLLSLALLALMLHLFSFLLFVTGFIRQWPHFLGVSYPFLYLAGPAFYFFVKSYGEPKFKPTPWHLLHLLPSLLLTYLMVDLFLASTAEKQLRIDYYYQLVPQGTMNFKLWLDFNLYVLFILAYVVAALYYIHHRKPYNTSLLKKFSWLYFALCISYLVLQSGFVLSGPDFISGEIILSAIMALVVLLMGYWILDIKQILPVTQSYRTSPLSEQRVYQIKNAILEAMEQQHLYLNPRLTISRLASDLEIPAHHISQVINNHMHTSFYRLINSYRIAKSWELLKTDRLEQVSIQAIGFDCGFSNKTSFYRAFKQHTGMTPTEFIRANPGE